MTAINELRDLAVEGQKARLRRARRTKFWKRLTMALLKQAVHVLSGGLWLMLAVDVAHDHWLPQLPTMGYWCAVVIVLLLSGVFSNVPPSKDDAK